MNEVLNSVFYPIIYVIFYFRLYKIFSVICTLVKENSKKHF